MRDLYELYALGLLEEPERSEVEAELASGSAEAHARLRDAIANNAALMATADSVEPPASLRDRVVGAVSRNEPTRAYGGLWAWVAACAALLVSSVYLGNSLALRNDELAGVRDQLRRVSAEAADSNAQLVRARDMLAFLNAPETRVVTFGPNEPKPKGKVLVNPGRGVLLVASNLPQTARGQIYEMWVIPKGGAPRPAGLFQSDTDGNALHLFEAQIAPESAVAVTVEPASGSNAPTSTPLFVAAL